MWLALIGLLLGLVIGSILNRMPSAVPAAYTRYTAIAILAAVDSVLGALRADVEGQYDNLIFVSGFVINSVLAVLLSVLGDRLGVELEYAAIVAFGVRIFNNLAILRRQWLTGVREWWRRRQAG